ncbi:hypothetical protein [Chlamydia sp. 17-3921]|uniref:hypothetical protein n=1 Tax=Chlamydia sp. 17-3921 TaxID=2675798 RepID=UPI0019187C25|nr:hypothetical protein [Chlamydia sp. 17-3921]
MEKLEFVSSLVSTDEDLINLNKQGIIAGPEEEKYSFFLRADSLIEERSGSSTSFPSRIQEIFDICPSHLQILYSNEGLDVWEAGCTWILENQVTIQLRKPLYKASRWLGIYSKKEILAHEIVHAVRMKFREPIFEEVLAYQTSSWAWRRFWGPLFRNSGESYALFLSVTIGVGITLWQPFWGFATILMLPIFFSVRLMLVQSYFRRAMRKIRKMLGVTPLWIMLRLTDKEIKMFATQPIPVIEHYAKKRKLDDIRWRQIYLSYFV